MSDPNIKRLIRKAQRGDTRAFEKLISLKRASIVYMAYRTLRNESDAEDAVQEAILGMSKDITRLENPEAFSSWMIKRVHWACFNLNKKKKRNAVALDEECENSVAEERHDMLPHVRLEDKAASAYIREKLSELTDGYRECLYLFYFEELSYAEIASVLEIDEKSVANRLVRGKQRLKTLIERDEGKVLGALPLVLSAEELHDAFALDVAEVVSSESGQVLDRVVEASLAGVTLVAGAATVTIPMALKAAITLCALAGITTAAITFTGFPGVASEEDVLPSLVSSEPISTPAQDTSDQEEDGSPEATDLGPTDDPEDPSPEEEKTVTVTPGDPQISRSSDDENSFEIKNEAYFDVRTHEEAKTNPREGEPIYTTNSATTTIGQGQGEDDSDSGLLKTGDASAVIVGTCVVLMVVSALCLVLVRQHRAREKK